MVGIESIRSIIEQINQRASVQSVYGEPIEVGDKTVVPIAKIRYGFGGVYGTSTADEGGPGGGGVSVIPIGALELTENSTRFVRYDSRKQLLLAFIVGIIMARLWRRRA